MNTIDFIILIILYTVFFLFFIVKEIRLVIKNNQIKLFDFFRFYYLIIYGIIPICSIIEIFSGNPTSLKAFKYLESNRTVYMYATFFISSIFYILINRIYPYYSKKIKVKELKKPIIDNSSKSFYVGNILLLIIGWTALILYTRAYGSIFGIFKYASQIRDNVFAVNNKFTFFQPFSTLLIWTSLNYLILLRNLKGKDRKYKIATILFSIISFFGYFVVLISLDGRLLTLAQVLIILFYLFQKSNVNYKNFLKKYYLYLISGFVIFFIVMLNMNNISGIIRNNTSEVKKANYNPVNFIAKEFGYTYVNNINILDRLVEKKNVDIRIDDDVVSLLFTFVPRRYRKQISVDLYRYNTSFTKNAIGQIPTDVITSSFYSLSYFGYLLFVLWIPFLIFKLQCIFDKYKKLNDYYLLMFGFFGIMIMLRMVAYYDLSMILYSCFGLIVSYIFIRIISLKIFAKIINKLYNVIINPNKILVYLLSNGYFNWLSDEKYIKFKYRLMFDEKIDLVNPKTFNEKIQWLKLYDRKNIYTTIVDKVLVKDYVAKIIGEEYIIPTLGVYEKFEDIDFDKLPNSFVMKCTHDSGGIIICKSKSSFDKIAAKKKIEKYLKRNYYNVHREWPYKDVKPRIIIEKYMCNKNNEDIRDYKFFTFNNKVKFFKIDFNRFIKHQANYFDVNKKLLKFGEIVCPPDFNKKLAMPKNLDKMIKLAEKLSTISPFLRVDFYEIDNKVYFGELTLYPASGFGKFEPNDWDRKIGDMLELDLVKKDEK